MSGSGPFEERLLTKLVSFQQDGDHASGTMARRKGRSRSRPIVAAATVMAVAAVLVATRTGSSPSDPVAAPATSLEARTVVAMSTASHEVVFHSMVVQSSGSVSELWRDDQTGASRVVRKDAAGQVVWETAFRPGPGGAVQGVTINYQDRTWGEREVDAAPGMTEPPETAAALQQQLAENLKNGRSMEDGSEVVDGRMTTRVKTIGAKGETSTLWIDNETLLPVKQIGDTINVTYSWAPRSSASARARAGGPSRSCSRLPSPPRKA